MTGRGAIENHVRQEAGGGGSMMAANHTDAQSILPAPGDGADVCLAAQHCRGDGSRGSSGGS